jgi:hypothetical protein
MSSQNTICERCYFSDTSDSDISCKFHIPDAVRDIKTINIVNGYNVIEKYNCRYGVSKNTVLNKITDKDLDLMDYAKNRIFPKYLLFIFAESTTESINKICESINTLSILPQAVSIVFKNLDINQCNPQKICEEQLGNKFSWKLHLFLDESKEDYDIINTALSTDTRLNKCSFIMFADTDILGYIASTDRMNRINYIINVDQPNLALLSTSKTSDYLRGMFMTVDNLKGISANIDKNIGQAIKDNYIDMLGFYD